MSYVRYLVELLPHVKGETESIRIAKGKYEKPSNIIQHFRKEWRNKRHIK